MTTTSNSGGRPIYLMLRMKPPWVFVDEIRRFVESFCSCACPGQSREAQIALAVHELMQNAIPQAGGEDVDLTLQVDPLANRIEIAVSNPCADDQFHELLARVERLSPLSREGIRSITHSEGFRDASDGFLGVVRR